MDVFIFLTIVTFQITLLAIVAIVFGQSRIAEQAISSLTGVLKNLSNKRKQKTMRPTFLRRKQRGNTTAKNKPATED